MKQAHFTLPPNKIHLILNKYEKLSLPKNPQAVYSCHAFAKSEAERGNSNYLYTANISTPQACFFVRRLNTPQRNRKGGILSMVAFSGQRSIVGCIPCIAVFHPAKRYRQTVESKAIALQLNTELSEMLFKFQSFTGEKRPTITVHARTEQEARQKVRFSSDTICIARLPSDFYERNTQANNRPNSTACNAQATEKNNSLPNVADIVYSDCTTTYEGNRYPYSSGLFLSSFYQFTSVMPQMGVIRLSEFVKWSICGNKAFLRTNNASRSYAVVETISHPHTVRNPLFTKLYEGISMLFKFITETPNHRQAVIAIVADTAEQARNYLRKTYRLPISAPFVRLPTPKSDRQFQGVEIVGVQYA